MVESLSGSGWQAASATARASSKSGQQHAALIICGRFAAIFFILIAVAFSGCSHDSADQTHVGPYALFHAESVDTRLLLEVADTPVLRSQGLMGRTSLAADQGMIFVWDRQLLAGFTMRNTLIPLSIAFIDENLKIVEILDMQPQTPGPYTPSRPFRYAIEANQGFFAQHGIETGETVELFFD